MLERAVSIFAIAASAAEITACAEALSEIAVLRPALRVPEVALISALLSMEMVSLVSTCTNLNFQRGRYGTVQQFLTVEVSCAHDTVDFSQTLGDFSVDRSQVRRTVSVGSSLNRQLTNTL